MTVFTPNGLWNDKAVTFPKYLTYYHDVVSMQKIVGKLSPFNQIYKYLHFTVGSVQFYIRCNPRVVNYDHRTLIRLAR